MPRRAREQSPTGIYHVIMRGINRQSIFEEEEDRQKLIEKLARFREKNCYKLFAYCLMDNHVHILVQEQLEPIGVAIKRISSSYVLWFNKKYERCGHLFQDRFKSEIISTDISFLKVLRYIHQNPIKARLVEDISDYKWSSYGDYIGPENMIDKDYVLGMFSDNDCEALSQFDIFLREKTSDECLEIDDNIRVVSDERLRRIIKEQFGIDSIKLVTEERAKQAEILKELKRLKGISIRQIARTTGVSQTRVWKA